MDNEFIDLNLHLSRKDFFIVLFIILMILSSAFAVGYFIRAFEDAKNLFNILGWWKIQKDCSTCDDWVCQATTQSLMPYNISGLKIGVQ